MNTRARLKWLPITLLALVLVSILCFLYVRTRDHDASRYHENVALLRQLKQLDARWELDVLRSRMGIEMNYDLLVDPLVSLNALWDRVQSITATEPGGAPTPLAGMSEAYHRSVQEKTRLIEHFKSHNAVLRNSLAFLPTAAEDARRALIQSSGTDSAVVTSIGVAVNHALLDCLIYAQAPSGELATDIQHDLTELGDSAATLARPVRSSLEIFSAHVQTVLREQPAVNALLDSIAEVPTATYLDELGNLLANVRNAGESQAQAYRRDLFIFAAALAGLLLYVAVKLIRSHAIIHRVNHELKAANETLEQRVEERTRELRDTQSELVSTARRAGMAEIATNVLHNVGNVLNSVNVSADLISARMRDSKVLRFADAVQLMNSHAEGPSHFLTLDERGRQLPGYFGKLADALSAERTELLEEIRCLIKGVDHIRDIVATQQSHAGATCVVEAVQIGNLLEDALRMNATSMARRQIAVVKEWSDVPEVMLDKHLLLQILVNLIANAAQAMSDTADRAHQLMLTARVRDSADGPRLQIQVRDTGEGISPDNLSRLFTHGFTTRKNGHGFGLHSCALAARAMQGGISAHSPGTDQGATFTLDLPLHEVANEAVANG